MPKPFLSIGIIFKNELRCLERCLKSLGPLRKAIPCELVMADTGSDDGSREIAEKYADILFDFPWIGDFSAARNAVMDRCTGRWYLSLDADEWLDENIGELVKYLRDKAGDVGFVTVRNYLTAELDENYQDSILMRLLRMSTKIRFTGAIHEHWDLPGEIVSLRLPHTVLHHDGYVGLNDDRGKEKRARNIELLKKELEKDPQNMRTLLECIESSRPEPDNIDYIRQGLRGIEERWPGWEGYGAPILRYAVFTAEEKNMPELEEWVAQAEELFPDSFYTQIDIMGLIARRSWQEGDYADCLRRSERYLSAMKDFRSGKGKRWDLTCSTVSLSIPDWEMRIRYVLARSCIKEKMPGRALELLDKLEPEIVREILASAQEIQTTTDDGTALVVMKLLERIRSAESDAEGLEAVFAQAASAAFSEEQRKKDENSHAVRPAYTLYLPLAGKCEAGTAAAVIEAKSVPEMEKLLGKVKKWSDFPITALAEALKRGATFPLPGMGLEIMDSLAVRLKAVDGIALAEIAVKKMDGDFRQLLWARSMVLAVIQDFSWKDAVQGQALSQTFAKLESAFLPRCYTPEALCEENILLLPSVHRFGWYCGRAFAALESGDASGYVRLLREGLSVCPQMKPMAEFLLEHTPQLKPAVPGELLALAEQVRTLLAQYAPDDPAVAMLKQSAAYQKVARLIEGPEPASTSLQGNMGQ